MRVCKCVVCACVRERVWLQKFRFRVSVGFSVCLDKFAGKSIRTDNISVLRVQG